MILPYLEKINDLTPKQYGFRKNKRINNYLTQNHNEIQSTFSNEQYIKMIILDIYEVYGSTQKPVIS